MLISYIRSNQVKFMVPINISCAIAIMFLLFVSCQIRNIPDLTTVANIVVRPWGRVVVISFVTIRTRAFQF